MIRGNCWKAAIELHRNGEDQLCHSIHTEEALLVQASDIPWALCEPSSSRDKRFLSVSRTPLSDSFRSNATIHVLQRNQPDAAASGSSASLGELRRAYYNYPSEFWRVTNEMWGAAGSFFVHKTEYVVESKWLLVGDTTSLRIFLFAGELSRAWVAGYRIHDVLLWLTGESCAAPPMFAWLSAKARRVKDKLYFLPRLMQDPFCFSNA